MEIYRNAYAIKVKVRGKWYYAGQYMNYIQKYGYKKQADETVNEPAFKKLHAKVVPYPENVVVH